MGTSAVNLTLLYIISEAVIPAPISIGINSGGNPARNTGFPRVKHWAGLIKPGMTNKGKRLLNHCMKFMFSQERLCLMSDV